MRILQIFNEYRFKGGEEAWVDTIPRLLKGAAQIEDLRFSSKDWIGDSSPSKLKQIILIGDNPKSRQALRSRVESFQPDILLFHNVIPVGSFGLYFEARKLGIPVLQYTHNFRPFSPSGTMWSGTNTIPDALHGNAWPEIAAGTWQGSRLKTAILAWHLYQARKKGLLKCIDHWLAISEFMQNQFIKAGIDKEKISVMRHCSEALNSHATQSNHDHYLYLGRLVTEKGIGSLLAAWRKLSSQLGGECPKLVIAGSGPLEKEVIGAAASNDSIQFVGFVESKAKTDLIARAKAVMVPSVWLEPLGLTTYDAYFHRRPVIASKTGALQETVQEGVTGWGHEPDDPNDIVRAVLEAEQAGDRGRDQRGGKGHQWLKEYADPLGWKNRFLGLCEKTLQNHQRAKK